MKINKDTLYWAKVKKDAIIPSKREEDAGYDIYPCFTEDKIVLNPGETVMVPTGISSAFHASKVAILKERGSTGTKGLGQRSGVIDSGYRGEWLVPITNHHINKKVFIIKEAVFKNISKKDDSIIYYPYEKAICQAVFLDIPTLNTKEIELSELKELDSIRGDGKLGSSQK